MDNIDPRETTISALKYSISTAARVYRDATPQQQADTGWQYAVGIDKICARLTADELTALASPRGRGLGAKFLAIATTVYDRENA